MNELTLYYKRIIQVLLNTHKDELLNAAPGHCMKLTGLPYNELLYLWEKLSNLTQSLSVFVINDDEKNGDIRFITATKLIELRNQSVSPLLVLIPIDSRTAAEDSYGNATFKEISLTGLESELLAELKKAIPDPYRDVIISEIFSYLDSQNLTLTDKINYLLSLEAEGYNPDTIGNNLHHLNLIPDKDLLADEKLIRIRLKKNIESLETLTDHSKSLSERLSLLCIERKTIQQEIAKFLKRERTAKTSISVVNKIQESYPALNFSNWTFPDLQFNSVKVVVEKFFASESFEINNGSNIFSSKASKGKLKFRVTTYPPPKDISDLKFFRIFLMAVNGGSGEKVIELKKQIKSNAKSPYRDITVELDPNIIEEGIYFIKVQAEDENGTILNDDDDFKDREIQDEWERKNTAGQEANNKPGEKLSKDSYDYKRTCDSDDFDFLVEEDDDANTGSRNEIRKDKVITALQAFMNYNIGYLKRQEDHNFIPSPEEDTNIWIETKKKSKTSTFHIKYDSFNNYQINIPTKLRTIENKILESGDVLAHYTVFLKSNPSEIDIDIHTTQLTVNNLLPKELQTQRNELFKLIREATHTHNGIVETFDFFNHIEIIKKYLKTYTNWLQDLKSKINEAVGSSKEMEHRKIIPEIQAIDTVTVKTRLPNKDSVEFIIITPLHPLMLSWFVNLYDLFNEWYGSTIENPDHIKEWLKELEDILFDRLSPNVLPLVLQSATNKKTYHHVGSLMFGWALYLKPEIRDRTLGVTSTSEQVKSYIRALFNIESHQIWENEINTKVIIRYLKNFVAQHPYADRLTLNLINDGDASVFVNALIELEKIPEFQNITYTIRLFRGSESLIKPGYALEQLLNPVNNITEEAEAFSQLSSNKLHPKLRYSVNYLDDYFDEPNLYTAHISFLINPFPLKTELHKPQGNYTALFCNDLIVDPAIYIRGCGSDISWKQFIPFCPSEKNSITASLLNIIQGFTAAALSTKISTGSVPATVLELRDKDYVLLSNLHDYSDWVITLDNHLGPELYDIPSENENKQVPFLLDYIPGDDSYRTTSYLTTRPTSEVFGLLGPHFEEYNLNLRDSINHNRLMMVLEDLRAVSSSLVLQLNSTSNKAFEVIGIAFTKRLFEKKLALKEGFIVPIDLHHELFTSLPSESKSRADSLIIHIHPETNEIEVTIVEIKCRNAINELQAFELKEKIIEQVNNTEEALKFHFDNTFNKAEDRLDRSFKNFDFRTLLLFYLNKASRYNYMSEDTVNQSRYYLENLCSEFILNFNKVGVIYDFSASQKHKKEVTLDNITFFTLGEALIDEILDENSDLNTMRLEQEALGAEILSALTRRPNLPVDTLSSEQELLNKNIEDDHIPETKTITNTQHEGITKIDPDDVETQQIDSIDQQQLSNNQQEIREIEPNQNPYNPEYDILIGKNSESTQYGILGQTIHGKKVALDLSETNTISLFGVQGGGKSYTIGTLTEMAIKSIPNINVLPGPLAGVIYHFSESMDYEPEFTSMIQSNNKLNEVEKLKIEFGADPTYLDDVIILTPKDKVEERKNEYPSIDVYPIAFNSAELNVTDWLFLLGATGNDSTYIKQLKAIMKANRRNLTLQAIHDSVDQSLLLSSSQKQLAKQRLDFAGEYIDDTFMLRDIIRPGRLILVDLRDEFIEKNEALGIFVIMQNIFAGVKEYDGKHFNKFLVYDEAHKYMDAKELTSSIVTAIREMRHKGVSIVIASQDPPSLPNEIIELSTVVILHRFNSPQWLKHIKKSITQIDGLSPEDMSKLNAGECFLWATKASEKNIVNRPVKVITRPRATLHGGATKKAH